MVRKPYETQELQRTFIVACRKCGCEDVFVNDNYRLVNDGDGHIDAMGSVDIECTKCHEAATVKDG